MMSAPATLDLAPFLGVREDDLDCNAARTFRAATESMFVIPVPDADGYATGLYRIVTTSASTYMVDAVDARHQCPDLKYRGDSFTGGCKHQRRVCMAINIGRLPAPGDWISEEDIERLNSLLTSGAIEADRADDSDLYRAVQITANEARREFGDDVIRSV
jgi:hypothetical protein